MNRAKIYSMHWVLVQFGDAQWAQNRPRKKAKCEYNKVCSADESCTNIRRNGHKIAHAKGKKNIEYNTKYVQQMNHAQILDALI